jgi:two-component system, OmpR family, response regulator
VADNAPPNLPRSPPASAPGDGLSATGMGRILVVDDDMDILEVTALALRTMGYTVECCSDPSLAVATASAFQPSLILLDAMMPGVDGPEVLRRLRCAAATCSIPVVFVTARVDSDSVSEYRDLGAVAVIGKPFDPLVFAARLKSLSPPGV